MAGVILAAALALSAPAGLAPADCPKALAGGTRCYGGRDEHGAYWRIAVPENWNRRLIVHAHGGPRLGVPQADGPDEDLQRFSAMVKAGYAWVGSTYRRGGYGVRMAAEDVETSRKVFWQAFGRPERTYLHGQSWGGNVAAKASELYALDVEGRPVYDGVLLTNGVLGGGTHAYQFRAGLRAVYQYYCRNHPKPDEPQYPLWQGLPAKATMSRAELRQRVDACTGVEQRPRDRSADQAARLRDILAVTGIRESQLVSHLAWATNTFQDLVHERLDGRNPFDNTDVVYRGSSDDTALNAGVQRFAADPVAVAKLAYDSDLSGQIVLPTLTLHALHDPVANVEMEAQYRAVVTGAGRGDLLVQVATTEDQHSKLSDSEYVAVVEALDGWVRNKAKPDAGSVRRLCEAALPRFGQGCHIPPPG